MLCPTRQPAFVYLTALLRLQSFCTFAVGAVDFDLDDALDALGSLEQKHSERRQEAFEDATVHKRIVGELDPSEHFAHSKKPRRRENVEVLFEVGEVVLHAIWGYTGIIVGWDEYCKAPEHWIQRMHGHSKAPKGKKAVPWRAMPNYSVLVVSGGSGGQDVRYVPEVNIARATQHDARSVTSSSPEISEYFDGFDRDCSRFIPHAWLRDRYPDDVGCRAGPTEPGDHGDL
eukprot:TRINITY_DN76113_c0_g1_i1.p1 TRINITY_DN76113_c0_g1~~TRINITY_DN76113_c0_g1_i1.p1  ORF type:complete len:230 (-),score=31.37 TRINITY_DN76113_c0_g1_i1:378-1067(-)